MALVVGLLAATIGPVVTTFFARCGHGSGVQPYNSGSGVDCFARVNADLATLCLSEAALARDLNGDGDQVDLRIVLLRSEGTATPTGSYVDVPPLGGGFWFGRGVLSDGSVTLGPWRVHGDGSITSNPIATGQVVALTGTSEVVREQLMTSSPRTYVVPAVGAPVELPNARFLFTVGNTVWSQTDEACRARPASNLNLVPGVISPNLVVAKVGGDGKVCLFTQNGAHLIADLAGTFALGAGFSPVVPVRLLDTRVGVGWSGGPPGAGAVVELGVPAEGRARSC